MNKTLITYVAFLLIFSCSKSSNNLKSLLIGKWKQVENEDTLEITNDGRIEVIENKNGELKKYQGVWTLYEEKKEISIVLSAVFPVTMKIIELNDTTLHCNMISVFLGEESVQEIKYFRQ